MKKPYDVDRPFESVAEQMHTWLVDGNHAEIKAGTLLK